MNNGEITVWSDLSELQYRIMTVGARRRALGQSARPDAADVMPGHVKAIHYGHSAGPAAAASISKSFARLIDRGLAERAPGGGVRLTAAGLDLANSSLTHGEAVWLDSRLTL
jgi:hypothetical protein